MSNLGLRVDPKDFVETDRIDSYFLKGIKQFRFALKPIKEGRFILKGLRFLFFGVAQCDLPIRSHQFRRGQTQVQRTHCEQAL
jgi:hypothetical protein